MNAAIQHRYGPPSVLTVADVPTPEPGTGEVRVQVLACAVTHGDRRLRAADYPSFTRLVGRLVSGLWRPRHATPGTVFAGTIAAIGSGVTRFAVGDAVYGSVMHSACAEAIVLPEKAPLARMPAGLTPTEAADLPYGALTALHFLRDLAQVRPGDAVLIVGASGGVGRSAVQIARHLGATVTGVCSRDQEAVRALGAEVVIDHRTTDVTASGARYDVIIDTVGAAPYGRARRVLAPAGRYVSTMVSGSLLGWMLWTKLFGRRRARLGVSLATPENLADLTRVVEAGGLRPAVAATYPLRQVVDAHARLEAGGLFGSVVIEPARA
ncbi:MAG: NAD(P)-dependent alcohol dehydrogenase [Myxococcales bacterium]|nr:NAD(P)-dependent alcohol dehydrogenase [Myxococcales bacterium]MCB9544866.1 NAD(P)-dependent alcohol dehydrogenase [Myxococcales bacterium]